MARFLMCPPNYFGIEYEINSWMRMSVQADHVRARSQWEELYQLLTEGLGATMELLPPVKGLPDLVFTANAGYVEGGLFVSSSFKHPQRRRETPYYEVWFEKGGYRIYRLPADCPFEGEGDALLLGDTIFAGYRQRSEVCSHQELAKVTGRRVLSLELVDPRFYHLDTCFAPLADGMALYYPKAFDSYGNRVILENVPYAIAVSDASAVRFACNAVVLGSTVVVNAGCDDLREPLERHGFHMQSVDLSEFIKSGGSAKCLVLRLD